MPMSSPNLVKIRQKYIVYSTLDKDPIFPQNNNSLPIFCGGKVISIGQEVYNLKENDNIFYISQEQKAEIVLPYDNILKMKIHYESGLIAVLPYIAYAMKILRIINPKLGNNILIIGKSFFFDFLKKILEIAGAKVKIYTEDIFNDFHNFDLIIINSDYLNADYLEKFKEIKMPDLIDLKFFSNLDIGISEFDHKFRIKYPYSYIRWDFRRNLDFFYSLVEEKKIKLNFIKI